MLTLASLPTIDVQRSGRLVRASFDHEAPMNVISKLRKNRRVEAKRDRRAAKEARQRERRAKANPR
jgi:hypothetical protein